MLLNFGISSKTAEMNAKARFDAQALLSGLIKYETILVVHSGGAGQPLLVLHKCVTGGAQAIKLAHTYINAVGHRPHLAPPSRRLWLYIFICLVLFQVTPLSEYLQTSLDSIQIQRLTVTTLKTLGE